jgi:hypothetical protein
MSRTRWVPRMRRPIPVQHTELTLISIIHAITPSPRRSLRRTRFTPPLSPHVTASAYTNAPRALVAAGSPCPSCSSGDGEMVPPEREPRTRNPYQRAKQHIEAKVPEVCEPRTRYVYCGADGYEDEDECVDGWRGVLVADGYYRIIVVGGGRRECRLLLVEGK